MHTDRQIEIHIISIRVCIYSTFRRFYDRGDKLF
jgi:hypothetical protein